MSRLLLCLLIAVGYIAVRNPGKSEVKPIAGLAAYARNMTAAERSGLSQSYAIVGRAIEGNPAEEPVFPDTASVRRAHRAALLMIWKGAFENEPGKYPGLREALEGEVARALGDADVPLNPTLQQQAAQTFLDISTSLK
jgi:hypothetical protein